MNETIEYYNHNAQSFIAGTVNADMSDCRDRFIKYIPAGGRLLDAGCGSGRDTAAFMRAGYLVDAFDASEEICRIASESLGISVACKRFEELEGESEYDGIWACASLLHVKTADLADVISRLKRMLKPGGILYASFKEGDSDRIKNGRFFHDMTLSSCEKLFTDLGFDILELFESGDVREDRSGERWVNMIGRVKR